MTTLPAMSDEQIRTIFRQCERAGGYLDVQDVARAIIAARDAQWQAAVDAAVMAETERCAVAADEFLTRGRSPFGKHVADHIRARTKEKT